MYVSSLRRTDEKRQIADCCSFQTGYQWRLTDARVVIGNYRRYFYEERLHGGLGYVPPWESKQQWLAVHPDLCMEALSPALGDLSLGASIQRENEKSPTAPESPPASAPMTGHRSGPSPRRAVSSGLQTDCRGSQNLTQEPNTGVNKSGVLTFKMAQR